MKTISIFQFEDYRSFLDLKRRELGGQGKAPIKVAAWANRLGYQSPRVVGMVLKGQRLPSSEMISRLSQDFRLGDREQRYFELLVKKARFEKRGAALGPTLKELDRLKSKSVHGHLIEADQFAYIADWYHLVLRQLIKTKYFREDIDWMQQRLHRKVSPTNIRAAIARMVKLKLLGRDKRGHLCVTEDHVRTTQDIPIDAVREHHLQMLARAAEALQEQPVDQRELTSITIAADRSEILAAKEMLRTFRDEFHRRFHKDRASDVFQLNLQFFSHTAETSGLEKGHSI